VCAAPPSSTPADVALACGAVAVAIRLDQLALQIHRDGEPLLSDLRPWTADGVVRDRFVSLSEGVIADERLEESPALERASIEERREDGVTLAAQLDDGRIARLEVALAPGTVTLELIIEGDPLRLGASWAGAPGERFAGLGARHGPELDQSGRRVRLGADRRYRGPDCPPDLLEEGGIPMGDCAPVPWIGSSHGYGAWLATWGDGALFHFGSRTEVSSRGAAGPMRLVLLCDPTPAARLRRLCRLTGFPALLPEWAYGHWKSRDVYAHEDDVLEDLYGHRWHGIPLDAVVLDSPWETQYNTWRFNSRQFPRPEAMVRRLRAGGVRTVVWTTPWVNLDSSEAIARGQVPPDRGSERAHRRPAPNYAAAAEAGHFVRDADGSPLVGDWWMGTGSPVDFTSPEAEAWWRGLARSVLELGVEGIKADDGEAFYIPPGARMADGRRGAEAAWAWSDGYRACMQRALDEVHPETGVLFSRSAWTGAQRMGVVWGGDQVSDFWSLRALVAATLGAAASGLSNWSHDVGGYLGRRLLERCPPELLLRWLQFGCFTPLLHAHGRFRQEPWAYDRRTLRVYRDYVLLHERLVPYVRAAAATAARCGLPIVRPLLLTDPADPRGWTSADSYGYGPSLWVAPVLEQGARERPVVLPHGPWIDFWTGERCAGGLRVTVAAPLDRIPVWVREGAVVVTYPAEHVARGLGDVPERERPLEATLWGDPRGGRAAARLADGTRIRWRDGIWSVHPERPVAFAQR